MNRALPILLLFATAACGRLDSPLPTGADEAPAAAAAPARPSALRGGGPILTNRCDDVALVRLSVASEDADGVVVSASYHTAARGNPPSGCGVAPSWTAKPDAKLALLEGGFRVLVPAPEDGSRDETYVIVATAPNGVEASLDLTASFSPLPPHAASEPSGVAPAPAHPSAAFRSGAILTNRCGDVAFVRLSVASEETGGMLATASYHTAARGNPRSNCAVAPAWTLTPSAKIEVLKGGFSVFVPAPPGDSRDELHVLVATAPNGAQASMEVTF